MTTIQADLTYYRQVNEAVRAVSDSEITVENVLGQRYLGCGSSGKKITIHGTPGNGLGQYLNGSTIEVFGNAQEAVGDTMNDGDIIIHGSVGDACGYGMRGGRIFIEGDCGYRGGIHMKAYQDHFPAVIIGGTAGSFLGEYQAGGLILVLGAGADGAYPVSNFCGTGMHGGKIVLKCDEAPAGLPRQVLVNEASPADLAAIAPYIDDFCRFFGGDAAALKAGRYFVLSPNPEAGYQQLYTYES
ncbi:MAG: glutamate synthase [Eubacteriales bacterium]|nr:glutamate synthase [Eubacteriales bacterium]